MAANMWVKLDETEQTVGIHRRKNTRWEDLDGAYNDGAVPSKMTRMQQFTQFGVSAWVATVIIIAAYYGLKMLWSLFSGLIV